MAEETKSKRQLSLLTVFIIVLVALSLGAGGMYAYTQYIQRGTGNEFEQIQRYLVTVIDLPAETPTFATVSDVSKLRGQTFFANAQNGDKVLIYPQSKMAILFRPSTKKIISVGPISINTADTEQSGTIVTNTTGTVTPSVSVQPTQDASLTIAIYNSTKTSGLAKTAEEDLKETFPAGKVVVRKDAKGQYEKTIVVDVTGRQKAQADALAKAINASVSAIPASEARPAADLLIILGTDYK